MGPKRKPSPQLTRLELQIMEVLWRIAAGTVQEVQAAIPGDRTHGGTARVPLRESPWGLRFRLFGRS